MAELFDFQFTPLESNHRTIRWWGASDWLKPATCQVCNSPLRMRGDNGCYEINCWCEVCLGPEP